MESSDLSAQPPGAGEGDYSMLERQVVSLLENERNFIANAANFAAFLYHELRDVNWLGFYFIEGDGSLVLGPFGGRPACTRLSAGRGVCGQAIIERRTLIVDDVDAFGDHIVCDSASRSEIVIPIVVDDQIIGVLDVDAPVRARFKAADADGLARLVTRFVESSTIPYNRSLNRQQEHANEQISIQTCRDHHVVIRYLIEQIDKADSPDSIRALLKRFHAIMVAHLRLEDDYLYPQLRASRNEVVRWKAERYGAEMGTLREDFAALFDSWTENNAHIWDAKRFKHEWAAFKVRLTARIDAEDDDLYVAADADSS